MPINNAAPFDSSVREHQATNVAIMLVNDIYCLKDLIRILINVKTAFLYRIHNITKRNNIIKRNILDVLFFGRVLAFI